MARPKQEPKWPVDKIERVDISTLEFMPNNSRTHSDEQVKQIAASMQEWGWTSPVLLDEKNRVIAGEGRVRAAQLLNIKQVPAMRAEGWTEKQIRAYIIADNKIAENAGWDHVKLKLEFEALKMGDDFSMDLTGFTPIEMLQFTDEAVASDAVEENWNDMPEFENASSEFRKIVVHFPDQKAVDDFAKAIKRKIGPTVRYLWFPEAEIVSQLDKAYRSEPPAPADTETEAEIDKKIDEPKKAKAKAKK